MLARYMLAPLRCAVLLVLAALGPIVLIILFVVAHFGIPLSMLIQGARWLPRTVRTWNGSPIPDPYGPPPPPPAPEADGWYREGNELYQWRWFVEFMSRWDWVLRDPTTYRDLWWAVLNPVVGGPVVAVPPGLIVGGGLLIANGHPAFGLAAIVLGFGFGTLALRLHSRWTRVLLSPTERSEPTAVWAWFAPKARDLGRLIATAGYSVAGLVFAALHILSVFPGLLVPLPATVLASRRHVARRRKQMAVWTGVLIADPYRPEPPLPERRQDGSYRIDSSVVAPLYSTTDKARRALRRRWTLTDVGTWRDFAWLLVDPLVTFVLAGLPLLAIVVAFGLVWLQALSLLLSLVTDVDGWFVWHALGEALPGLDSAPAVLSPVVGLALVMSAASVAPALLRAHTRVARPFLVPTTTAELAQQIEHLTDARAEANDVQAAELRRIERDLHDGAQARWVALGMSLGAAEMYIDRDPETAKRMIAEARDSAGQALSELREFVRGIHPPVLAERGLGDAVRAVALDLPIEVEVRVDLNARQEAPIEACAYFTIVELLTNATKHARATRVRVSIWHDADRLHAIVTDDGVGGAKSGEGTGLYGIQRRLATFDGILTLSSPRGGPTTARMEVPCASSSPRTSTSSEKE